MRTSPLRALMMAAPLAGLLGVSHCGTDEGDNGNTNWLKPCHDSSECGPYVCECGRCENACSGPIDCSLPPGAICSATSGVLEGGAETGVARDSGASDSSKLDSSTPETTGNGGDSSAADGFAVSNEPCGTFAAGPIAVAASPMGLMAVAYGDGVVTLRDNSLVTTLEFTPQNGASSLALSTDGTLLATAGSAPEIRVWSTVDGHPVGTLAWTKHQVTDSMTALFFSPNATILLASANSAPTVGSNRVTTVLELDTGKVLWSRTDAWASVSSFADAGATVLIADESHAAVYDVGDGRLRREGTLTGLLGAPVASPMGNYLVDGLRMVRTSDFQEAYRLIPGVSGWGDPFFSADNSLFLVPSMTVTSVASISAVQVGAWGTLGSWTLPNDSWGIDTVWKIAPTWGQRFAVIDTAGRISLTGADLQKEIAASTLGRGPRYSMTLRYAPGGALLASAGDEVYHTDALVVWDTQTHKLLWSLNDVARSGSQPSPNAFAFSADGKRIYAASDGPTRVLEAVSGTILSRIGKPAVCVAMSPDGATLYASESSGATRSVVAYKTSDGSVGPTVESDLGSVVGLEVSPDGTFLALVTQNGDVALYRRADLQQIWKAKGANVGSTGAPWLVFSPDGKMVALTFRSGVGMLVWDTASGKELVNFKPTERMGQADFSPDGHMIAVGDEDGVDVVRLSDMSVVQTLLPGQGHFLSGLAFGPAGDRLVLGGNTITSLCGVSSATARK